MAQIKKSTLKIEGTAGSENPKYVMLWTNEELLSMIAFALSEDDETKTQMPLVPSSTVILEFYAVDNQGTPEMMVDLFVNDQQVKPAFCGGTDTSCTMQTFLTALGTSIKITSDTAAECNGT